MAFTYARIMEHLNIGPDEAETILGLIRGEVDPMTFTSVQTWVNQCFTSPRKHELVMCALNEVMEGSGVEVIRGMEHDRFYGDIVAEYINLGDTYTPTVVYDTVKSVWRLLSWGAFVEYWDTKYQIQ